MTKCSTPRCKRPHLARGLCRACYMRDRRSKQKGYVGRRPNGANYADAMHSINAWSSKFFDRINRDTPSGCHEWMGTRNNGGYGIFYHANQTLLAHRVIFVMSGGHAATPVVMHTCDNPCCVNPKHLKAGSYADNMADMDAKDRRVVGKAGEHLKDREHHPRARPVMTPAGEFKSASLASEGTGLTARTIARYCQKQLNGYKYI